MSKLIQVKSTNNKELESVLGRLENVSIVIGMFGYFLNNIRSVQLKAKKKNHNIIINGSTKLDLKLARLVLQRAADGVSMNTVVFRTPDHTYIGDAS